MEVVVLFIGLLSVVNQVTAQVDENHRNLQNQITSLQAVVENAVTEMAVNRKEHKELEHKYVVLWDELSILRHNRDRAISTGATRTDEPARQPVNPRFPQTRAAASRVQSTTLCTCPKGDKGDTGSRGPTGNSGYTGTNGVDGQKGDSGLKGDPGIAGFNGDDGLDGQKGDRGLKGDPGIAGFNGIDGLDGDKGDRGFKGNAGPTGQPGAKGDTGTSGIPGPKGSKGEPGAGGGIGNQGQAGTKIAFTASVSQLYAVRSYGSIVYDHVDTNVGIAYNSATGKFTCSIAGVYVLTWSAEVNANHYIELQLTVNGHPRGYLHVGAGVYDNSGSATVILELSVADHVYIVSQTFTPRTSFVLSSSFSGYLLH